MFAELIHYVVASGPLSDGLIGKSYVKSYAVLKCWNIMGKRRSMHACVTYYQYTMNDYLILLK